MIFGGPLGHPVFKRLTLFFIYDIIYLNKIGKNEVIFLSFIKACERLEKLMRLGKVPTTKQDRIFIGTVVLESDEDSSRANKIISNLKGAIKKR